MSAQTSWANEAVAMNRTASLDEGESLRRVLSMELDAKLSGRVGSGVAGVEFIPSRTAARSINFRGHCGIPPFAKCAKDGAPGCCAGAREILRW